MSLLGYTGSGMEIVYDLVAAGEITRPVIGVDLGAAPALVLVTGTPEAPVLLVALILRSWDAVAVTEWIGEQVERYPGAVVYCEETFTERRRKKGYLADVGRRQEAQASFLEGFLSGRAEVRRVPPCDGGEADAAWLVFGQPAEGKGPKGEHLRDALAVGLKGLSRRSET